MAGERGRLESLISTGIDLAGGAVGGALGFLAGGPWAAAAAGAAGITFTTVLQDMASRLLSERESTRVGATAAMAITSIKERLDRGERLRDDGFFRPRGKHRSSAQEVFEGVLLAAKNAHEEKKTLYLGQIFANVSFDSSCLVDEANYLLNVAESLTYAQFVLLHLFASPDLSQSIRPTEFGAGAQVPYATVSLLHAIRGLCDRNLLIMQRPGDTHHTFVLDINSICPAHLKLAIGGQRLHYLLGLATMPQEDIDEVSEWLK